MSGENKSSEKPGEILMNDIEIRAANAADAAALLGIYAPYVRETAITFEHDVPSEDEFRSRIENTLLLYPYLVAEEGGEIAGYAYASRFRTRQAYAWDAETSIYIRQDKRKSGIGRLLYEELEKILSLQGVLNLYAGVAYAEKEDEYLTKNSFDFHLHMGYRTAGIFTRCGFKFNRWYDVAWMEKYLGSHGENPSPVKPFSEIRDRFDL